MKIQISPNKWSCLPTAFAIATNYPVDVIINQIGHDGSEIIFPERNEPYNRRGFMIQEIMDILLWKDWAVVHIEALPMIINPFEDIASPSPEPAIKRFNHYLKCVNGVLCGMMKGTNKWHACAWNHYEQMMYDPNGFIYPKNKMESTDFYAVVHINPLTFSRWPFININKVDSTKEGDCKNAS